MNLLPRDETYVDRYNKLIAKSPYYSGDHPRTIRRDAVRALDICVRVGRNEEKENPRFDVNKFCQMTKEWAAKRFGEENIAGMVFRGDEQSPNIHIIVIPMTTDGRLCANDVVGGPKGLATMQTEIAEQLASLGLQRGMQHSIAQSSTLKAFYEAVDAARIDSLPEPEKNEDAVHYAARANAVFNDYKSQKTQELLDEKRKTIEVQTQLRDMQSDHDLRRIKELKEQKKTLQERLREQEKAMAKERWYIDRILTQWKDIAYTTRQLFFSLEALWELFQQMKCTFERGKEGDSYEK